MPKRTPPTHDEILAALTEPYAAETPRGTQLPGYPVLHPDHGLPWELACRLLSIRLRARDRVGARQTGAPRRPTVEAWLTEFVTAPDSPVVAVYGDGGMLRRVPEGEGWSAAEPSRRGARHQLGHLTTEFSWPEETAQNPRLRFDSSGCWRPQATGVYPNSPWLLHRATVVAIGQTLAEDDRRARQELLAAQQAERQRFHELHPTSSAVLNTLVHAMRNAGVDDLALQVTPTVAERFGASAKEMYGDPATVTIVLHGNAIEPFLALLRAGLDHSL